ncbi:hypothetical protein DER46DRAFT_683846 [Fusarium sp. MPI-SDFR-AT-0072]|nr:hypothetical protein DER46DRAFT_683846 [Fusarium sp. MPI-SDFR-AT-0072]
MAIASNNTPSTEGHAPPPPNVHGVEKPVQNSSGEAETDQSTESAIFHLKAAWITETIDVSLKVGDAGIAFMIAPSFLALVSILVALGDPKGSAGLGSGNQGHTAYSHMSLKYFRPSPTSRPRHLCAFTLLLCKARGGMSRNANLRLTKKTVQHFLCALQPQKG